MCYIDLGNRTKVTIYKENRIPIGLYTYAKIDISLSKCSSHIHPVPLITCIVVNIKDVLLEWWFYMFSQGPQCLFFLLVLMMIVIFVMMRRQVVVVVVLVLVVVVVVIVVVRVDWMQGGAGGRGRCCWLDFMVWEID